ncbi:hypothetical protein LDC_2649, partial [sediment metagenome]
SITCQKKESLELRLIHDSGPELKPLELIKAIFKIDERNLENIRVLKIGQIIE